MTTAAHDSGIHHITQSIQALSFDKRVAHFKDFARTKRALNQTVILDDVFTYFPECYNPDISAQTRIPDHVIAAHIECFIAEFIERKLSLPFR